MAGVRTKYQGVRQIVQFNWPLYAVAVALPLLFVCIMDYLRDEMRVVLGILIVGIVLTTFISLLVSYWIYDMSPLYSLRWLPKVDRSETHALLNVHAGFDETSPILRLKFESHSLHVVDFYDPVTHTEPSIKRARRSQPAYPGTIRSAASALPFENATIGTGFLFFAAHEIRNDDERAHFFRELHRILAPDGTLIVTEHLRNGWNFLAYTIGFFHFLSRKTWLRTFESSGWKVDHEIKITPFVTSFILKKYGSTS